MVFLGCGVINPCCDAIRCRAWRTSYIRHLRRHRKIFLCPRTRLARRPRAEDTVSMQRGPPLVLIHLQPLDRLVTSTQRSHCPQSQGKSLECWAYCTHSRNYILQIELQARYLHQWWVIHMSLLLITSVMTSSRIVFLLTTMVNIPWHHDSNFNNCNCAPDTPGTAVSWAFELDLEIEAKLF
jgi:hypothetical protein